MQDINYKIYKLKEDLPEMSPGDTIKVFEKIPEEGKKKSQTFEGILIAKKHGKGVNATFALRAVIGGVGVEKTYSLHSPLIEKIKVVKKGRARRAKLYYLREKAERAIRKKLRSQRVIEVEEKPEGKEEKVEKTEIKKLKEAKAQSKETEKKEELKKEKQEK